MRRGLPAGRRRVVLPLALALLAAALPLVSLLGRSEPTACYDRQLDAALRMERCMEAVRGYKAELGIPPEPLDIHQTGMLGEEFNGITTTLGSVEAKRTAANGDMAALAVRLFEEAGLKRGDVVGAGFSGSFPAMNLAVLSACAALELEVVYLSSAGSSTYGANNPGLTFPEMAHRLYLDGLLPTDSAAVTLGGGQDVGKGMDEGLRAAVAGRLERLGPPLLALPDYGENIARRMALYEELGPIDCFVAVGGNVTSMGRGADSAALGQGLLTGPPPALNGDSGLVQRYLAAGLPVVNLLNIKRLTADYGLPYDPPAPPAPGTSAVYFVTAYPRPLIALIVSAALALLLCYHRLGGGRRG